MKIKKYKEYYICKFVSQCCKRLVYFRVKNNPDDSYALHHGSFVTLKEAKKFIDDIKKS